MSKQSAATDDQASIPGLIGRPAFQLSSLLIPMRWEVTRRHGYYQDWWRLASEHLSNAPLNHPDDPRELFLRKAAVNILGVIGVTGNPPNPETEFDQFDSENPNCVWLYDAIQPLTFRALAGMCLRDLPKATLHELGNILLTASREEDENSPPVLMQAIEQLVRCQGEGLNSYPNAPFVAINPAASQRHIQVTLKELLPRWREERNLTEQRDRSDKYSDYLRIWDLREGWLNGSYESSRERTFREIAAELKENQATIVSQYRSAFELIVGQPYSPATWLSVFGPLKFMALLESVGPVSRRRPLRSPIPRPVPESSLRGNSALDSSGIASMVAVPDGIRGTDLFLDLEWLISHGRTDAEIVGELELPQDLVPQIASFRERLA